MLGVSSFIGYCFNEKISPVYVIQSVNNFNGLDDLNWSMAIAMAIPIAMDIAMAIPSIAMAIAMPLSVRLITST